MEESRQEPPQPPRESGQEGLRLDSWKEIAAHLNRDVRTVQRWEKSANLPVRRMRGPGLRAVFAYTAELDGWLRQQAPASLEAAAQETPGDEAASDEAIAAEVPAPAKPDSIARTPAPSSGRRWIPYVGAALLVASAAIYMATRPAPPLGPFTVRPITSDPGTERDPDISPDGKYVAYAAESPDLHTRILVRLIEGGQARTVTSAPDNEWSPAWSPDGERIAFLRGDLAGKATLLITAALGGDERAVAEVHPVPRRRTALIGHVLAWTSDGRRLVVADADADGKRGLTLLNLETGSRTPITSPGEGEVDVEPTLSANGRLLLFNRIRGQALSNVFVQDLDAAFRAVGPPRKLPSAGDWNGTPRLLESRKEVLICAGTVPRLSLWREQIDGSGKPVSLGIMGENAVQSAVDRLTGRIVFRTLRFDFDVLRFALPNSPSPTPVDPPVESFVESTFADRSPAYSPDGSRMAFISDRTGRRQIWVSDSAGEKPVEWSQPVEVDFPTPAWSHDGSRIVFTATGPSGLDQLFVASRTTQSAVRVTNDGLDYAGAAWSPDDSYLLAAAADNGVYAIYRLPSGGGAPEKILPGYSSIAGVDPTGNLLYVVRRVGRNQAHLDYVRIPGGTPVPLAALNFSEDAWVTRDGVYYLERRGDAPLAPVSLKFRSHAGVVKLVQEYSRPPGRGISVSADGRYAVTARVVPPISDLMLLETSK